MMKFSTNACLIVIVLCLGSVCSSIFSLYSIKENLIENQKDNIKTILSFARNLTTVYVDMEQQGLITKTEAEERVVELLSAMHKDHLYLWANDNNGIARVHIRPEKIGHFQTSYTGHISGLKNQEFLFVEENNVKPFLEKRVMKINGVTKIPNWSWVVGFGVYMNDINEMFWQIARKVILINFLFILLLVALLIYRKFMFKNNANFLMNAE